MEQIIGTGSAVPEGVADNHMLTRFMETSDEWIRERTGISSRHIADGETVADLAIKAAKRAIENAGIHPEEIGLVIVATSTSEQIYPCVACEVQGAVGAIHAGCFDLNAACSGFLSAYQMACGQIRMGAIKSALVIGAEVLSHVTDGRDRGTAILFGDGAGAVVVTKRDCTDPAESVFVMGADGCRKHALTGASGIGRASGHSLNEMIRSIWMEEDRNRESEEERSSTGLYKDFIEMDGRGIYQFAVKQVPETVRELLTLSKLQADEIDYFVLHQANKRIIESIAKHLRQPVEKFPVILTDHGNMSSACIPVLLDHMNREGMLKRGMKLVLSGFGAGLTWAGATLVW